MKLQQRFASAGATSIDEATRSAEFVASTETVDSHRSIVRQDWNLTRFASNPVVLFGHDPDFPIGTAAARVDEGVGLVAKITFASGDATAERAWNLVRQGVLRGVSVGFRPGVTKYEKQGEREIAVYSANELFELSVTAQPSNPDALAREQETIMSDEHVAPDDVAAPVTHTAHDAEVRALNSAIVGLTKERDAAIARAAEAESKVAKLDDARRAGRVEDLIGKKITEAQRDTFLNLIRESERTFDAVVATLPDLGLGLGEGRKIPDTAAAVRPNLDEDAIQRKIDAATEKRMADFGESRMVAMRAAMAQLDEQGALPTA